MARQNRNEPDSTSDFKKTAASIYTDEIGGPVLEVTRLENHRGAKKFVQKYFDGSKWVLGGWKKSGKTIVPYHYLNWRDSDKLLFHVEGEKCVEFLISKGFDATTSPGGANGWDKDLAKFYSRKSVVILPDADDAGKKYAESVAA